MNSLPIRRGTDYPTPFRELNDVLWELVSSMQAILGQDFVGAFLQGSFAIGDFDQHSDVDWIVAVEQELSEDQVEALQAMHNRIYELDIAWAQHLEGSYYPKDVLRLLPVKGEKLWYLDNGARSLIRSDHCNTIVVRWTVRENGVSLAGPEPASLVDPIPVELLRREMRATGLGWGGEILADPEQINNRFYQGFAVLTYCRILHDLHMGRPGSKRAGAEWAKANLDPSWAGLIDRAWGGRPDPARSVREPADPDELKQTLAFVRYVMELVDRGERLEL